MQVGNRCLVIGIVLCMIEHIEDAEFIAGVMGLPANGIIRVVVDAHTTE